MKWHEKLNLEFPYDWMSNSMKENVLISAVLERSRFNDLSKICAYFGLDRVESVAIEYGIDINHSVRAPLMRSIRKATEQINNESAK